MKRISPGTVTVAVLAIVVGLVAAYVARHAYAPQDDPGLAVVVARVNLTENHRITAEDLKIVYVTKDQVPDGALAVAEAVQGRVVHTVVRAGQPVLDQSLYPIGVSPTLTEYIPVGQRALTISVQGAAPSAGIVTGAIVDIALTVEDDHPDLGGLATKTLLRRVKILTGPIITARGTVGNNIVVAVTPEQANTLITAQRTGTLSVTLCANEDVAGGPNGDDLVGRNDLLGLAAPRRHTIERWNGGQMSVIEVGDSQIREAREATAYDEGRHFQSLAVQPTPVPPADDTPEADEHN